MVSLAIASALSLSGCDDETISDVEKANDVAVQADARVIFDPSSGNASDVAVPNDILFSGTQDGTLNFPVADPSDFSDPLVAASALDGWSTHQPFVINFELSEGVSLDAMSIHNGDAVSVYEAVMGGDRSDADCTAVPQGIACKGVAQLILGEDYIVQTTGSSLVVVPLKPLKPKTTYILALTDGLKDSNGYSVRGSDIYELTSQDINELPITDPSLGTLQALFNSYENLAEGFGIQKDSIVYTMAMTTQSINDTLMVTKQLLAASLSAETALFPTPVVMVNDAGYSAADALIAGGLISASDPELVPLYKSAKVFSGSISIPNYLAVPTEQKPFAPINTPWKAMCDSGAMLAFAPDLPEGPLSDSDAACMSFGLRDIGIDVERNLTKYNPVPKLTEVQQVDVQATEPDVVIANIVRGALGLPGEIAKPEGGWPVVILQHGITSRKEDMLALTGLLSVNGFATVAIDHPLHNSRGYPAINAVDNPFAYMNIGSLLNARDNLRQSTTDTLALRLGINFMQGIDINPGQVHYVGHSLGAMTGVNFLALTNSPLDPMVDPLFKVQASVLGSPAGGIANFLFESGAFGDAVKANLAYGISPEFKAFADAMLGEDAANPLALISIWPDFIAGLDDSQAGSINSVFELYTFAAQSIIDSADMVNYANTLRTNGTPVLAIEMVGNGADVPSDTVIPLMVSTSPLAGSTPMLGLLGLGQISETTMSDMPISGAVKYVNGDHGSLLSPSASIRATQEIQTQIALYLATQGTAVFVNDSDVILK